MRLALVLALGVLVVLVYVALQLRAPASVAGEVKALISVTPQPVDRPVRHADDLEKPGTTRSVMGQHAFTQQAFTTGPSPDVLRFTFDAPVRILGTNVSVDIVDVPLVEVAVGIDPLATYGLEGRDWLIHTSDQNGGLPSKIDEFVWFGDQGFEVDPGEGVAVVAWMYNHLDHEVWTSPEVIVYYEWL